MVDTILFGVCSLLIIIGILGIFVPRIPASVFIWLGCFTFAVLNGFAKISLEMIGGVTILASVLFSVEWVLRFGGSKKGGSMQWIFTALKFILIITLVGLFVWKVFF